MLIEDVFRVKDALADQWEKEAKVLRELKPAELHVFELENETMVGEITSIKDKHLCIRVWASSNMDYKMRNTESRGIKRRTYPLALWRIISSKGIKIDQAPLYVNFKYLSPQFKNKFFR
jgi:hypothetical protein